MGFDLAHTISSISKLILRAAKNADDGGSGDSGSKDSRFESICSEFNHNKLMKKYQGYAQNEKTIFYKGIMPSEKVLDLPVDCNTLTGSVNL